MIKIKKEGSEYKYELWIEEDLISARSGFTHWEDILDFLSNVSAALGKPVRVIDLPYIYED